MFANGAMTAAFQAAAAESQDSIARRSDSGPPRKADLTDDQRASLDADVATINAELQNRDRRFKNGHTAADYLDSRVAPTGKKYGVELGVSMGLLSNGNVILSEVVTQYWSNYVEIPGSGQMMRVADWHNHLGSGGFSKFDLTTANSSAYLSNGSGSLLYFNYQRFMNDGMSNLWPSQEAFVEKLR